MFGSDWYEGGDVNADSLDGFDGPGGTSGGGGGDFGQKYYGAQSESSGRDVDPAWSALGRASERADKTTDQGMDASKLAEGIGKAGGLATGFHNLFNNKAQRVRINQRKHSRLQAQAAVDSAGRAIEQYKEDSQRQEQGLQQSYAGRGIGESSIQQEGMLYYKNESTRKMAQLAQNLALAESAQRLTKSQIADSYAQPYLSLANSIFAMA